MLEESKESYSQLFHENGKHLTPNTIFVPFKKIVHSLGFDDVRFHDLRHSCGLYARENGASMEIQLMLGHSKISTTMDIYGHKSDLLERETAQKMVLSVQSGIKAANLPHQLYRKPYNSIVLPQRKTPVSLMTQGFLLVEVTGFEPATSCSRSKRATKLRYTSPWSQ